MSGLPFGKVGQMERRTLLKTVINRQKLSNFKHTANTYQNEATVENRQQPPEFVKNRQKPSCTFRNRHVPWRVPS